MTHKDRAALIVEELGIAYPSSSFYLLNHFRAVEDAAKPKQGRCGNCKHMFKGKFGVSCVSPETPVDDTVGDFGCNYFEENEGEDATE